MAGCREADTRAVERAWFSAWASARFARAKRLHGFGRYLAELRPKKPTAPDELLAYFRGLAARGVGVRIRRIGG